MQATQGVKMEIALNAGCQLREDVEWAKCKSTVHFERCDGVRDWPYIQASEMIVLR